MKKVCLSYFTSSDRPIHKYKFPLIIRFRELGSHNGGSFSIGNELQRLLHFDITFPDGLDELIRKRATESLNAEIGFTILNELCPFIILDGFDEIPTHKEKESSLVELRLLASKLDKAKFVLTCRTGEFNYHLKNTDTFEISSLTKKQINKFATNWIEDSDKAELFLRDIYQSPFADTVIKPLSLAHLCAIYERIGSIPDRPKTVYRKVVSLMLEEWDEQRSITRESKYSKFESDRKFEFLSHLAYHLTTTGLAIFTQSQLRDAYVKICKNFGLPESQGTQTANELESHTGLFLQTGFEQYEFAHKSLQEYLCAEYLVKLPTLRASPYTQLQSHSKIAYFGACTCLGQKRNSTQ
jgi:predicted NACHT family NTPase